MVCICPYVQVLFISVVLSQYNRDTRTQRAFFFFRLIPIDGCNQTSGTEVKNHESASICLHNVQENFCYAPTCGQKKMLIQH
jgi:hypothetical protein